MDEVDENAACSLTSIDAVFTVAHCSSLSWCGFYLYIFLYYNSHATCFFLHRLVQSLHSRVKNYVPFCENQVF